MSFSIFLTYLKLNMMTFHIYKKKPGKKRHCPVYYYNDGHNV